MKKILMMILSFMCVMQFMFADITFENTLSSDVVTITKHNKHSPYTHKRFYVDPKLASIDTKLYRYVAYVAQRDYDLGFTNKAPYYGTPEKRYWHDYEKFYDMAYLNAYNDYKDNEETITDFAPIKERMFAEYTSDKIDVMAKVRFILDDNDDKHFKLTEDEDERDYYVKFRPFPGMTLAMHADIWTDGSYLPIWDDNVSAGNLGSKGFTLCFEPGNIPGAEVLKGLRLASSVPMNNWLDGDEDCDRDSEDDDFAINFGIDYTFKDLFSIGTMIQDAFDDDYRSIGVFGSVTPGKVFALRAGFSYYEDYGMIDSLDYAGWINLGGDNLFNLSMEVNLDAVSLVAEAAWTFDRDNVWLPDTRYYHWKYDDTYGWKYYVPEAGYTFTPYDMYTSVCLTFGLGSMFKAQATGMFFLDTSSDIDELDPATAGEFLLIFQKGKHTISAGVDTEIAKDMGMDLYLGFPLKWKYTY